MTNSLTIYEQMTSIQTAAQALFSSGFFSDVKTQAQAMVKVMAGAEIGLPPFASMTGIHIIQGKPTIGANLIATLVKKDPRYDYRVKVADNKQCILTWYEGGKVVGESSFTMDEANAAGLTGKQTWKAYASDMLFARALTRGARRYAPGIFGGAPIYTPEEMGVDTDEDGQIIQGEIVNVTPAPNPSGSLYGNGDFVAPAAAESYAAYVEAHGGKVPDNVHKLRDWYKAQKNGNGAATEPAPEQPAQLPIDNTDATQAAISTARGEFD